MGPGAYSVSVISIIFIGTQWRLASHVNNLDTQNMVLHDCRFC